MAEARVQRGGVSGATPSEVDHSDAASSSRDPADTVAATVTRRLEDVDSVPSVVTVGVFDGVHIGHQMLLGQVGDVARRAGLRAVAVTFDRNPIEVVRPGHQPPALQTLDDKIAALATTSVDLVHVLNFDVEASREPAQDFVARVLAGPIAAREVMIGANFRFGHRALGDLDLLEELGPHHGFTARAIDLVGVDGLEVSSTAIRAALADGDVATAARGLGRPHRVGGPVVRGDGRGATIGVPTANVAVPDGLAVPSGGVYATRTLVGDELHDSVTNVGIRPTFGGDHVTVESHLLDADLDLYGRTVAVDFVQRLRDEQRFDGVDALVSQIHADIAHARDVLG
ncbi:MAG TPA: bifunctional riboflavin kinase/FAD synthetase [Nitriliruptoraceae bacterium]|nr:bifunctional riboflavin kinase/FAD synthetase [Nitriliruptoraceae bacterium]